LLLVTRGPCLFHTTEAHSRDVGAGHQGSPPWAEEIMAARKQWSDLSERTRRLLITAAVAEGILKVAALIDIKRRPPSQIRGPKWI
jgi:hypothetical protein